MYLDVTTTDEYWAARGAARRRAAELSDDLAALAEDFAAVLEQLALRGDAERRLRIAEIERETARVARRNATKLRANHTQGCIGLERLPSRSLLTDD
jgi:hypothetical protein